MIVKGQLIGFAVARMDGDSAKLCGNIIGSTPEDGDAIRRVFALEYPNIGKEGFVVEIRAVGSDAARGSK